MENDIRKFLEFNGRTIYFLSVGGTGTASGTYWIAVKPICEALGVDYIAQFKALKSDEFYQPALSEQTIQIPGDQGRNMFCISEKYVYGWLAGIKFSNTMKPETKANLIAYRRKCYDLLFEYFHGTITGRRQVLLERLRLQQQADQIKRQLFEENPLYVRLGELEDDLKDRGKLLRGFDDELVKGQLSLF